MPTQPTRTRPRNRRDQIITAAMEAFRTEGYHQASMGRIAREVDVSAPALYRHFQGKADLLFAAAETAIERVETAIAGHGDEAAMLDALCRLAADGTPYGALLERELQHLPTDRASALRQRLLAVAGTIADTITARVGTAAAPVVAITLMAIVGSTSYYTVRTSPDLTRTLIHRALEASLSCAGDLGASAIGPGGATVLPERSWLPRRLAIIYAAPHVAGRVGGYESATLDDFAAGAGLAGSSVYSHFASKAELEFAVAEWTLRWAHVAIERALVLAAGGQDVLHRAFAGYEELVSLIPTAASPFDPTDPALPADLARQLQEFADRYLSLWDVCARAARPDTDPASREVLLRAALAVINRNRVPQEEGAARLSSQALVALTEATFLA